MHYVYLLQSVSKKAQQFVGICSDLKDCLRKHNARFFETTSLYTPWSVEMAMFFRDEKKALQFQKYLSSEAGTSFCEEASLVQF